MKVKVAEDLLYRKTIYKAKEAFERYVIEYEKNGEICNFKDMFLDKTNKK